MKKLSKLSLRSKLEKLDQLTDEEQNEIKGGVTIYYPNYSNPNVSVSCNPSGGGVGYTWRF